MAIKFELRRHDPDKVASVDIFKDEVLCGTIYPQGDDGIKLVSAHIAGDTVEVGFPAGIHMDNGMDPRVPVPAVLVRFNVRPYVFDNGKLRRGDIIHALQGEHALCGFSPAHPSDWPDGHIWAHHSRPKMVNCPDCKKKM